MRGGRHDEQRRVGHRLVHRLGVIHADEVAIAEKALAAFIESADPHVKSVLKEFPTLVEVKRSSDTRIRREVVGQMLDYAANGQR